MSDAALFSVQEQQLLDAFQQAIDSKSFDRLILSQYKGELEHLEKLLCVLFFCKMTQY